MLRKEHLFLVCLVTVAFANFPVEQTPVNEFMLKRCDSGGFGEKRLAQDGSCKLVHAPTDTDKHAGAPCRTGLCQLGIVDGNDACQPIDDLNVQNLPFPSGLSTCSGGMPFEYPWDASQFNFRPFPCDECEYRYDPCVFKHKPYKSSDEIVWRTGVCDSVLNCDSNTKNASQIAQTWVCRPWDIKDTGTMSPQNYNLKVYDKVKQAKDFTVDGPQGLGYTEECPDFLNAASSFEPVYTWRNQGNLETTQYSTCCNKHTGHFGMLTQIGGTATSPENVCVPVRSSCNDYTLDEHKVFAAAGNKDWHTIVNPQQGVFGLYTWKNYVGEYRVKDGENLVLSKDIEIHRCVASSFDYSGGEATPSKITPVKVSFDKHARCVYVWETCANSSDVCYDPFKNINSKEDVAKAKFSVLANISIFPKGKNQCLKYE